MQSIMKKASAGALMGGALLFTGGMGVAAAQPVQLQDGLVNVALGDTTILENVQVEAVAQVLANVCPNVAVDEINVLAESVDTDGGAQQVADCEAFTLPVNLTQNGPGQGNAPFAPGQNR